MTIEEQIARFELGLASLERSVLDLEPERFTRPMRRWSPRDVVAHLVGWNRYIVQGSRQILKGELPFYDVDPGEDYSKVNAVLVRTYDSESRSDLLAELRQSARELVELLRSLAPADWAGDFGVRHRGEVVTIRGTVDELIDDYFHHRDQIAAWASVLES